jgi:HAD superfamily hydrolase (TIGR01549 family)
MCWKILVDFDGTLSNSDYVFASKLDGLFGMEGIRLYNTYLFEIHRKIIHMQYPNRHDDFNLHWSLLLSHLGIPYDDEKASLLSKKFEEAIESILVKPMIFPDVTNFLEEAIKKGCVLCLSTGENSKEKAEAIENALGKSYFHHVIGEDLLGYLKNNKAYYEEALRLLKWKAEATFSIGDTILTDILPAKEVGIRTIWVNRNNHNSPIDPEEKPDYESCNLSYALDFIEKMR